MTAKLVAEYYNVASIYNRIVKVYNDSVAIIIVNHYSDGGRKLQLGTLYCTCFKHTCTQLNSCKTYAIDPT